MLKIKLKFQLQAAAYLTEVDRRDRWVKPEGTTLTVNVDAALFAESGNYSCSCVARDSRGLFLEALTSCRVSLVSLEMAEAMGVKEALSWIKRKTWQRVIVETDGLIVVQAIRSPVSMLSYFGNVIGDCRNMLKKMHDVAIVFISNKLFIILLQLPIIYSHE